MNVAVFVKHVPDTTEADLQVAADGRSLKAGGLPYQMNEWDRFALEEGVRLKEASGGTLTAFLLGPEEHEETLRRCLAVGADRAVRVWDPALERQGPVAAARALAAAVGGEAFDLCLCGAQADDDGYGLVGPTLAVLLAMPSASLVNRLEVRDRVAVCARELEGGWSEVVELDLPALITVQTGINEPRYVSVLGIRKARSKPIDLAGLDALGLSPEAVGETGSRLRVEALAPPPPGKEAELFTGSPEEIAGRFVAVLKEKGGVL
ncbi:MAG: electron transfer flavoprotein subunit beta/FixA family protein [Deferrisomatales bacterium]|nr:electron transfer flavoprotein subunit beta/FixA family protein [Deferrisomatales bacterium]